MVCSDSISYVLDTAMNTANIHASLPMYHFKKHPSLPLDEISEFKDISLVLGNHQLLFFANIPSPVFFLLSCLLDKYGVLRSLYNVRLSRHTMLKGFLSIFFSSLFLFEKVIVFFKEVTFVIVCVCVCICT